MRTNKLISQSDQQTILLGKKIARTLKGREIIGLSGSLGAGKTVLTRGILLGLGYRGIVTSPTFTIVKKYSLKGSKISTVFHVDAYRLKTLADAMSAGLFDFFDQPNSVVIIEWIENIKKFLPQISLLITIKHSSKNIKIRRITIKSKT